MRILHPDCEVCSTEVADTVSNQTAHKTEAVEESADKVTTELTNHPQDLGRIG